MSKTEKEVSYFIKSAKTKKHKDGKVLDLSYTRFTTVNGKTSKREFTEAGTDFVHPDLVKSLKAFLPHFLLLGERANINDFQPSYFKKKEYEKKEYPYEVTGIHIKEQHERLYVIMVGKQILKSGRVISMTIPMVNFDPEEDDEDKYPFHEELKQAIQLYLDEVTLYMDEDKFGVSGQTELELDNVKELPKSKAS